MFGHMDGRSHAPDVCFHKDVVCVAVASSGNFSITAKQVQAPPTWLSAFVEHEFALAPTMPLAADHWTVVIVDGSVHGGGATLQV